MPMLTENQIALMTKRKKRVTWTTEELSKGFTSAFFSQRCHRFWIHDLAILLPSVRTLNRYAARMVIAPGILNDVLLMLKGFTAQLSEAERQAISSSHEVGLNVVSVVSDCGGSNVGLWKELNVSCSRNAISHFFKHSITGKNIYLLADAPHTERMNVPLAAEFPSHTTATCLRRYFPDDSEVSKLADWIDMVNYWFDVMNCNT
ncbi:hypothetical protein HA402_007901, partial [Bradysia odoriphaga]